MFFPSSSKTRSSMDPSEAPTPDVDVLIAQLQAIVADPKGSIVAAAIDDTKRQQLKQLTRAASFALEEPFETVQRLVYSVSLFCTPAYSAYPKWYQKEKKRLRGGHTASAVQRQI